VSQKLTCKDDRASFRSRVADPKPLLLPGEFLSEHRSIAGEGKTGLQIDDPILYQSRDFAIKMLHALRLGGFHSIQQRGVVMLTLFDASAGAGIGL